MLNNITTLILLFFSLIINSTLFADPDTFTSAASGLWSAGVQPAGPWTTTGTDADGIPDADDIVIISSGHTITMDGNPGACLTLTISGTASWTNTYTTTVGAGGLTLNNGAIITGSTTGTLTVNGTLSVASSQSVQIGRITLNINSTTTIDGTITFNNSNGTKTFSDINISGSGTWNETAAAVVACTGSLDNDGSYTTSTGTHTFSGAGKTFSGDNQITINRLSLSGSYTNVDELEVITTFSGSGSLTQGSGSYLYSKATISPSLDANTNDNTVEYHSSGSQSVKSTTYRNLIISDAGTSTIAGPITVNGNMSITGGILATSSQSITGNASGTFSMSTGTTLYVGATNSSTAVVFPSNFTTGNISLAAGSLVQYQSNGAQTISSTPNYANLTITDGAATTTKTPNGTINVSGDLTLSGTNCTFAASTRTINVTGDLAGASATASITFTTGSLNLGGDWTSSASFTCGTGTVTYNGSSGTQTVGAVTYYNLTINNSSGSNVVATGTYAIGNNLAVNDGTVDLGDVTVSGTMTIAANKTVNMAAVAPSVSGLTTINGTLNITSATGTKSFGAITIAGGGSMVFSAAATIQVSGNFQNGGTFTHGLGKVIFNGTTAISGGATTNFFDVDVATASSASLSVAAQLMGSLTLVGTGTFNTNNLLTLHSNSTYTARIAELANPANFTGNVTMRRFVPGSTVGYNKTGWVLIGSPLSSFNINTDFDDDIITSCQTNCDGFSGSFYSFQYYNEAASGTFNQGYRKIKNIDTTISTGLGIWMYHGATKTVAGDTTIDVYGAINKSNVSLPVTYNDDAGQPASEDGWNLVCNPYPSPISWADILANAGTPANVEDGIYVWNADLNGFASYASGASNPAVGSGGIGDEIPSFQGFYVHLTGTSTLDLTESMKVNNNNAFLKKNTHSLAMNAEYELFRLQVKPVGEDYDAQTVIRLNQYATTSFDKQLDARCLYMDETPLVISTMLNGEKYSINSVSYQEAEVLFPVWIKANEAGDHIISALNLDDFDFDKCLILEDLLTGTMHDLRKSDYSFNIASPVESVRFVLHVMDTPPNGDCMPQTTSVSYLDKNIRILSLNYNSLSENLTIFGLPTVNENVLISIYSGSGQEVFSATMRSDTKLRLNVSSLSAGIYMTKVRVGTENYSGSFIREQ